MMLIEIVVSTILQMLNLSVEMLMKLQGNCMMMELDLTAYLLIHQEKDVLNKQ